MRRSLLLLAGVLACRRDATPVATGPAIADSAGIQIVTSRAPAWGDRAAWKLAGSAALTLGGLAGDSALDFIGIVGARRLGDGGLVVANGGTGSCAGSRLPESTCGRLAAGRATPGKFAALSSLYAIGDTPRMGWTARILTRLSSGEILRRFPATG
jgi:hypothetical protein